MTELIWEGKYNKDGKKVAPVKIALPFQTIETVNESAQKRQKALDFFAAEPNGQYNDWKNRLIWGDKKYVLPSLLPEFAGKVNLIYIDPPFDTGANFSFTATIPDNPEAEEGDETTEFVKEPSIIEQKAYRDTWGKGLDSYMQWFYETAILLRELLTEDGSIYIHLDWHIGHYAKLVLDEIFGYENFRNEIAWCYTFPGRVTVDFQKRHDTILRYCKSDKIIFNKDNIRIAYKAEFTAARGVQGKKDYEESLQRKRHDLGKVPESWWNDISNVSSWREELLGYPTQKPEAVIERIIKASSNEGDLILDCFGGSGTTGAVAEKLNRKWIACDLGRFAIHTMRKRLLAIDKVKPFIVQNLGKYERQQWMKAEFENPENRILQEKAYRKFIIELYQGRALDGYIWLHGAKAGRMVHVGSVEAPVTVEDVKAAIIEFWKLVGKDKNIEKNGIDFLGWDFAFDVNEIARQFAAENKVNVSFRKIPREVLEKRR